MNRNLPTFASQTVNAHKRDTFNGFALALIGAAVFGATLGILGAAGVPVALIGIMLATVGVAGMFGPRPIDATLFQPAVALPLDFACNVKVVRDAKSAVVLRVGTHHASWLRAQAKVLAIFDVAPSKRRDAALVAEMAKVERAHDATMMARARWLGDWPATNHHPV